MLLHKHSVCHVTSRDALNEFLRLKTAGAIIAAEPNHGDGLRCNAITSKTLEMLSISCDFSGTFKFDPFDAVRLVIPTHSGTQIVLDDETIDINPRTSAFIVAAGAEVVKRIPKSYHSLSLRIDPSELRQKLNALCGDETSDDLRFQQPPETDERILKFVRRPLLAAAHEFDHVDPAFHANLLEEIKAVTLTRLLLFVPHNYSSLLSRKHGAPSRAQMRLAESYLDMHWNKPLDINGLAAAVGVSARTVLRYFHEAYGETPRHRMQGIRLRRARDMLRAGDTTVVEVALKCGYSSLGNFAASYRRRFGELPSKTLRTN